MFLVGLLITCCCYYLQLFVTNVAVILAFVLVFSLKKKYLSVLFLLLGVLLAGARIYVHEAQDKNRLDLLEGEHVELEGNICKEVDYRRTDTRYTVCLDWNKKTNEKIKEKVLVNFDLYPRFEFGQRVSLTGKASVPGLIEDFHYDWYLKRFGIRYVFYKPVLRVVENEKSEHWLGWLFVLKNWFIARLNQEFQEPFASFLAGLLLGYRGGLGEELLVNFQRVGLTHIIAISGANIALVILLLEKMLFFVPKKARFVLLIFGLVGFCLLVGMSASVVRAAIMGSMIMMARYFGRDTDTWFVLLFTAGIMTWFVPEILAYDAGFQLSFLALIGIVVFAEKLTLIIGKLIKPGLLLETLVMTLSAQFGTMSLSILLFKQFSLISVLANILVVPMLPLATLLGGLVVLFADLKFLSGIFVFIDSLLLAVIVKVVSILASIPYVVLIFANTKTANVVALGSLLIIGLMVLLCQFSRKSVVGKNC